MVAVDPEAVRSEATQWINLADDMSKIQRHVDSQLWLSPAAFFIGNFSEIIHYPAYRDFWNRMNNRLSGAAIEFELIGIVLRRIAEDYEQTDEMSRSDFDRLFTATEEDVASVTEEEPSPQAEPVQPAPSIPGPF